MLLDVETLKKSSIIDPSIEEFAKNNPAPPIDWNNASGMKAIMAAMSQQSQDLLGPPESSIIEVYKDIPMRDGFQSTIKIARPATTPAAGSPLIVFFFGGGFVGGDMEAGTPFARAWARLFGAVTVCVSYRLGPEYKFPASWHDSIDSVKWIAEHASELHADPSKGFLMSGISAGGNLAAVSTLASISEKFAHPVTGQWLCVPSLMDADSVPEKFKPYFLSLEHNKDAPILSASAMEAIKTHLESDSTSALRYPVLNKEVPLEKIPPTFLQADGLDPLRDDALIYDEMLKEAGVETRINFYPGCPHGHFAFFPGLEISNKAVADVMTGVGWLLKKQISPEQGLGAMVPAA
ncbi:uncharacterized protein LTR77_001518 [Saxophila tyrrhenica]|uniref:Alpha/beta hydrolase fold-3 domain-containing protein n=1 Tax=Saxophila tyrrhenica TaxID=1690608 RepID=A0AAV9PKB9_9PEZI|nr:hypothetical protein LTR77_001518 [Saxophila tyrrhenica]